ncbi:putative bacteriophage tail fiber protein [Yersinia mollaretii]|uniref:phage tail protein n=1 Tax=Yersinia mollaretii TaxID=33060 RepID=UPI0005E033EE|nr:phage tail protein [Yersinia mollaretii]CQR12248.1 putative bacteriophage tail fiber protein [Yersinia mollaretii]
MSNEILPFGLGAESNVMTQAEYEALAARSGGFSSGVAKSEQLNKVWRQSSFVASVLADFIANHSGNDVLDNGNTATLLASLELAIKTYAGSNLPPASLTQKGIVQLSSSITSASEILAATPKAVRDMGDKTLKVANNLSEILAAGPAAVAAALKSLTLTGMGIGLPSMTVIANFDWQNFAFTSGANYLTAYNTWLNPPAGVTYNAGTAVSITVDNISSSQVGLTLIPLTVSNTNYRVFKVIGVGAAGSRVFTVREIPTSANPVPISGGGTGAATAAEALVNLGLGDGSLIPIGVPLPYPLSAAPTGWLKCNGSTFSTTTYPKLALVYPSGVLPDMRGNAIRGWDDGRGVDTGRALLSEQADAIQNITGSFWVSAEKTDSTYATGAFTTVLPVGNCVTSVFQSRQIQRFDFDASHVARTAAETRMRNIAFNHIVRAA